VTRGSIVRIALLFVAGFVLALIAYVAATLPGAWFPAAPELGWRADDLRPARGPITRGDAGEWIVGPMSADDVAVLSATSSFRASEYPAVRWIAAPLPADAEVSLLWRNEVEPGRLHNRRLRVEGGRAQPLILEGEPGWVGHITGIALAVKGPLPEALHVRGALASPMGAAQLLRDRLREWFAFEGWSGTSINTIVGGSDAQPFPLPWVIAAAVALAALAFVALGWRSNVRAQRGALALVVAGLIGWAMLDARWVATLAHQSILTARTFGGKDSDARHAAADDAELYAFVQAARAVMPPEPVRVFVAAPAQYFRGRAAYHLYPENAFYVPLADELPPASAMRPGDWLLVYRRPGIAYDASRKMLRWDGQTRSAELALVRPGSALFRLP
jgi:hypothetical protein